MTLPTGPAGAPIPPYLPYPDTAPADQYVPRNPVVIPDEVRTDPGQTYPELVTSFVRSAMRQQVTALERRVRETKVCQRCHAASVEAVHISPPTLDDTTEADAFASIVVRIMQRWRLVCRPCGAVLAAAIGGTIAELA